MKMDISRALYNAIQVLIDSRKDELKGIKNDSERIERFIEILNEEYAKVDMSVITGDIQSFAEVPNRLTVQNIIIPKLKVLMKNNAKCDNCYIMALFNRVNQTIMQE